MQNEKRRSVENGTGEKIRRNKINLESNEIAYLILLLKYFPVYFILCYERTGYRISFFQ